MTFEILILIVFNQCLTLSDKDWQTSSPCFNLLLVSLWVVTLPFTGGRCHSWSLGLGYLGTKPAWPLEIMNLSLDHGNVSVEQAGLCGDFSSNLSPLSFY